MNRKVILLLPAVVLLALAFTGCNAPWHRIDGNHDVISETRYISGFNEVYNEGEFDVYIYQGSESRVIIEAESNLVPLIETNLKSGHRLEIETDHNLDPNFTMKLYIYTPDVNKVVLSGSGKIYAEDILADHVEIGISGSGDIFSSAVADETECWISGSGSVQMGVNTHRLDARISGSGSMELWGNTDRSDLTISGSGSFHGYDLVSFECFAHISGSGNMQVSVVNFLEARISGSGSVYYLGSPTVSTYITGSGKVIHP